MKCKHFFVFAVPKFACLWKNRKSFCGMKNNVYFCIEYGKELIYHQRLQRIAERVAKGGHNIPEPIARRRYVAGINNLFNLFMSEVDYWDVYDNSEYPRKQIACGGKDAGTVICNELLFAKIQNYVR